MKTKLIARIVLLAVVALALGAWVVKEFAPSSDVAAENASDAPAEATRPDGVTVINFHGKIRCRTCIGIGELSRKTIDDEFAAEEKSDKLRWQHINYDEPENAHYVTDYGLVSSTVLVTLWKDGKEVKWERLDRVWDYFGNEPAFRIYVAENVRLLLNQL